MARPPVIDRWRAISRIPERLPTGCTREIMPATCTQGDALLRSPTTGRAVPAVTTGYEPDHSENHVDHCPEHDDEPDSDACTHCRSGLTCIQIVGVDPRAVVRGGGDANDDPNYEDHLNDEY